MKETCGANRRQAELIQLSDEDRRLLAGVSAALEEVGRRSGDWIACRVGCTQCCLGPFEITQLDGWRLRRGLGGLERVDAARAERVGRRVSECLGAMEAARVEESMDDVPCPVLDPETGSCDLYEARPMTCRTFGPVMRTGVDTFGACELCYVGASAEEMAACAVEMDPEGREGALLDALEAHGLRGMTTVAAALADVRERLS